MSEPGIRIEQRGEGIFAVSVVRRAGDHEAGGTVVLRQDQPPDAGSPAHVVLAGSRAWLALGEARFEAGDFEAAVRCAQSGLEELGASYGGARVEDDTEMKILLAKRYLKQGQLEPAASHLLRTLGVRVALYAEHNAAALAE